MPENSSCELPLMSWGRPAISGLMRSKPRSSNGTTWYFTASMSQSRCSSASLSGFSVARLLAWVQSSGPVQLPHVGVEWRWCIRFPRGPVLRDSGPALEVDAAVAHHLEVLHL